MDALLRYARARQPDTIALIRRFVECESPSHDAAAVNRFAALLAESVKDIAKVRPHFAAAHGRHLRCEFILPVAAQKGQILVLGHSDTVWPLETLRTMPFRRHEGRLWGPGVFDMKGGLALFIMAIRALRDLNIPVARKVMLQVNSDEEIGSPSSRSLTEEIARKSAAVLVLEPAGPTGSVKTARKGVGEYHVVVRGVAAHAGLDYEKGASAITEMARQVDRIAGFTRLARGITVSPGVIAGGTRSNVVAAECSLDVDVRVPRASDAQFIERQFAALRPFDKRCHIEISGGINRPPMERTAGIDALFQKARALAADVGVELDECAVGGASDGNFTAALGVPTLDGLGAVGEGAHAANESIFIDRLAVRTALLAKLVAGL